MWKRIVWAICGALEWIFAGERRTAVAVDPVTSVLDVVANAAQLSTAVIQKQTQEDAEVNTKSMVDAEMEAHAHAALQKLDLAIKNKDLDTIQRMAQ